MDFLFVPSRGKLLYLLIVHMTSSLTPHLLCNLFLHSTVITFVLRCTMVKTMRREVAALAGNTAKNSLLVFGLCPNRQFKLFSIDLNGSNSQFCLRREHQLEKCLFQFSANADADRSRWSIAEILENMSNVHGRPTVERARMNADGGYTYLGTHQS